MKLNEVFGRMRIEDPAIEPGAWKWDFFHNKANWLVAASALDPNRVIDEKRPPLVLVVDGVIRARWIPTQRKGYVVFPKRR